MAKNSIRDYSATASSNTDIQSIDIDENCAASGINNAIREMMADTADFVSGTVGIDVLSLADDDNSAQIKIQAPSAVTTTTTFTLPDGDGDAYQVLKTDGSGTLGWVNVAANPSLIINGAMTIDQRNSGSSVTPTADQTYVLDRFGAGLSVASKFSLEQTTTVPAGFKNSMKATVVSAYTPGSAEWFGFFHKVEGLNASHLDFGTSDAKTLTLSFWVRSSVTGDYGFSLANSAQNRAYPVLYNISAADTWEHKTITIAGDTSGTWLTTNGIGLNLLWSLGAGSSYLQTANAWGTGLGLGTTGQTNWITNAAATFYITGVQLEVGQTATPFEHRSYGDELARCQRYFFKFPDANYNIHAAPYTSSVSIAHFEFPVTMRTLPTMVITNGAGTSTSTGTSPEGFHHVYNDQYSNYISTFTADAEL